MLLESGPSEPLYMSWPPLFISRSCNWPNWIWNSEWSFCSAYTYLYKERPVYHVVLWSFSTLGYNCILQLYAYFCTLVQFVCCLSLSRIMFVLVVPWHHSSTRLIMFLNCLLWLYFCLPIRLYHMNLFIPHQKIQISRCLVDELCRQQFVQCQLSFVLFSWQLLQHEHPSRWLAHPWI